MIAAFETEVFDSLGVLSPFKKHMSQLVFTNNVINIHTQLELANFQKECTIGLCS